MLNLNIVPSYNNYKMVVNCKGVTSNKVIYLNGLTVLLNTLTNKLVTFKPNKNNKRIYNKHINTFIKNLNGVNLIHTTVTKFNGGLTISYKQYNYNGINIMVVSNSFTKYNVVIVNKGL